LQAEAPAQKFDEQVQLPECAICMSLTGVAQAFAGSGRALARRKNTSSACQSIKNNWEASRSSPSGDDYPGLQSD
jgi:hypothetical protein